MGGARQTVGIHAKDPREYSASLVVKRYILSCMRLSLSYLLIFLFEAVHYQQRNTLHPYIEIMPLYILFNV